MEESNGMKDALPLDLIREYREMKKETALPGEGGDLGGDEDKTLDKFRFNMYKRLANWGLVKFDKSMKSKGASGFGDIDTSEFSELAIIVHEEMLAAKSFDEITRWGFYLLLALIAGENMMELREISQKHKNNIDKENQAEENE